MIDHTNNESNVGSHMDTDEPAIRWLLRSDDPSIRFLTLTDLLDEPSDSREAQTARDQIPSGKRVRGLLGGRRKNGGLGVHPYQKWAGAHWRLVSLTELGYTARDRNILAAIDQVLRWLTSEIRLRSIKKINGLTRRCASQEGNALAVCSRVGVTDDARVKQLAESLQEWQWPDGGWNCDKDAHAWHSSFHESLVPMLGLIEYHRRTGEAGALKAAERTAEFLLRHRLFRSEKSGKIIDPSWVKLHYPPYWHYDILQALRVLALLGRLNDPRAHEALDVVEGKRLPDGRWGVDIRYWRLSSKLHSGVEVADWGRKGPNEMITLNALHVLKQAGRLR